MGYQQLIEACKVPLAPELELTGTCGKKLLDFWRWAYSDFILGNTNRGLLRQYLVGCALDLVNKCQLEWEFVDYQYRGLGIEVKTKSLIRTTDEMPSSEARYCIPATLALDRRTNTYRGSKRRWAD